MKTAFTYLTASEFGIAAEGRGLILNSAEACRRISFGLTPGEAETMTRIWSTAPDLLEAAKGALAALSQNATFPSDIDAAKAFLSAAIAKATGE